MSRYTLTLRQLATSQDYSERLETAFKTYSIPYDLQNVRLDKLYLLFLAYYDDYEIGYETPAMFLRQLQRRMLYLIDKYAIKFKLQSTAEQDLMQNGFVHGGGETYTGTSTNDKTRSNDVDYNSDTNAGSTNNNETRSIENDTPEKNINITTEFSSNNYATRLNHNKGSASGSANSTTHNYGSIEDVTEHTDTTKGYTISTNGEYRTLEEVLKINNYRNYEIDFISDLEPLFMQVY